MIRLQIVMLLNFSGSKQEKKLQVDRTPETRWRWGISVGIDWTSHALHGCEDSETTRVGRLTTRNRTIIVVLL